MVQVPTDSNMADINTKPLRGQRIIFHVQTRVGEPERKPYEQKKNFAGKVNKTAKMNVRIVTLDGLQPMVTESSVFLREIGQLRLEVEGSNRNWKIGIMIIIIGFAAMTFAM